MYCAANLLALGSFSLTPSLSDDDAHAFCMREETRGGGGTLNYKCIQLPRAMVLRTLEAASAALFEGGKSKHGAHSAAAAAILSCMFSQRNEQNIACSSSVPLRGGQTPKPLRSMGEIQVVAGDIACRSLCYVIIVTIGSPFPTFVAMTNTHCTGSSKGVVNLVVYDLTHSQSLMDRL